jgi:hypothetical protein
MKAVKVQYTVKASYAATNKANIQKVMADLRALHNPGIRYSAFVLDDGKTFVHIALYPDQATADIVANLPAFQDFRGQLQGSQPEAPPQAEDLTFVGSAFEIFGD